MNNLNAPGNRTDASFMLQALFERKREITQPDSNARVDPFFLIKECAELSNLRSLQQPGAQNTMEQELALANYGNLCQTIADRHPIATGGYDPKSIEEKMKKLKFASKDKNDGKDMNWFKNLNAKKEPAPPPAVLQKNGLTDEQERDIHREMIPQFIAKQQELQPQYDKLQDIGKEIKQIQAEFGVEIKQVQPAATTSFMNRRGSQAKQYEIITSQMRQTRMLKNQEKNGETRSNASGHPTQTGFRSTSRGHSVINGGQSNLAQNEPLPHGQARKQTAVTRGAQRAKADNQANSDRSQTSDNRLQGQLSQISSYHKEEDENICKQCGYYGCDGQLCLVQQNDSKQELFAEQLPVATDEEGQEFHVNTQGLIDVRKTEQLFHKRDGKHEKNSKHITTRDGYTAADANGTGQPDIPHVATRISNTQQTKREVKFLKPGGNIQALTNRKSQAFDANIQVQTASQPKINKLYNQQESQGTLTKHKLRQKDNQIMSSIPSTVETYGTNLKVMKGFQKDQTQIFARKLKNKMQTSTGPPTGHESKTSGADYAMGSQRGIAPAFGVFNDGNSFQSGGEPFSPAALKVLSRPLDLLSVNENENYPANEQYFQNTTSLKTNRQKSVGSNMTMLGTNLLQNNKPLYTTNQEGEIQFNRLNSNNTYRKQVKFNKSISNFLDTNQLFEGNKNKQKRVTQQSRSRSKKDTRAENLDRSNGKSPLRIPALDKHVRNAKRVNEEKPHKKHHLKSSAKCQNAFQIYKDQIPIGPGLNEFHKKNKSSSRQHNQKAPKPRVYTKVSNIGQKYQDTFLDEKLVTGSKKFAQGSMQQMEKMNMLYLNDKSSKAVSAALSPLVLSTRDAKAQGLDPKALQPYQTRSPERDGLQATVSVLSRPFDLNSIQPDRLRVLSPETYPDQSICNDGAIILEDKANEHRRNTISQSRNSSSANPQVNSRTAASVLSKKSRNDNWHPLASNTVGEPQPSVDEREQGQLSRLRKDVQQNRRPDLNRIQQDAEQKVLHLGMRKGARSGLTSRRPSNTPTSRSQTGLTVDLLEEQSQPTDIRNIFSSQNPSRALESKETELKGSKYKGEPENQRLSGQGTNPDNSFDEELHQIQKFLKKRLKEKTGSQRQTNVFELHQKIFKMGKKVKQEDIWNGGGGNKYQTNRTSIQHNSKSLKHELERYGNINRIKSPDKGHQGSRDQAGSVPPQNSNAVKQLVQIIRNSQQNIKLTDLKASSGVVKRKKSKTKLKCPMDPIDQQRQLYCGQADLIKQNSKNNNKADPLSNFRSLSIKKQIALLTKRNQVSKKKRRAIFNQLGFEKDYIVMYGNKKEIKEGMSLDHEDSLKSSTEQIHKGDVFAVLKKIELPHPGSAFAPKHNSGSFDGALGPNHSYYGSVDPTGQYDELDHGENVLIYDQKAIKDKN